VGAPRWQGVPAPGEVETPSIPGNSVCETRQAHHLAWSIAARPAWRIRKEHGCEARGQGVGQLYSVCLAARVSGGLKSRSVRDHGPISKGGGHASPAGERGRYGEPYTGTQAKAGHSQGGPEATVSQDSGGQGAHREVGSEGLAENHQVVIEGRHPQDEPVGQKWGMVEPALWRRRRMVPPHCTTVCAGDTVGKRRG
jgi:hypothetical protein